MITGFFSALEQHFQHEEIILSGAGYEQLDEHIMLHRKISYDLREIHQTSNQVGRGVKVVSTAREQIFRHELSDDQKYWHLFEMVDESKPMLIDWSKKYETDEPEVDEHHKALVNYLNRLFQSVVENHKDDLLVPELEQLCAYTEFHFSEEELLFSDVLSESQNAVHKSQHASLITDLKVVIENVKTGDYKRDTLPDYLKYWFLNHVQRFDKPAFAKKPIH